MDNGCLFQNFLFIFLKLLPTTTVLLRLADMRQRSCLMSAKSRITAAPADNRNMQKGTAVAIPFVVYSVVHRLVIRHSPKIRFQISIEHQVCVSNRVIVDQIIQL